MAAYGPEKHVLRDGRAVVLRHCRAEDAPVLGPFRARIAAETTFTLQYVGRPPDPIESVVKRVADDESNPHALNLGAFDREEIIGHLLLWRLRAEHPWIAHIAQFAMMIVRDYWGQGLGRRMLEIMEAHALATGVARIEATVDARNERGVELYRRFGFAIEGVRRGSALINGAYRDEYYLGKTYDSRVRPLPAGFDPVSAWREEGQA
jgi:RimJ/RimL family protein N-acetyltransferase